MTPSEFKRTYYPAIERVCAGTGLHPLFVAAQAALETGCIVTSEEHNVIGGLGAAVSEFLSENCPTPVVKHGVNDEFGRSGKAPLVMKAYHLTPEGIAAKAKQAIALKK